MRFHKRGRVIQRRQSSRTGRRGTGHSRILSFRGGGEVAPEHPVQPDRRGSETDKRHEQDKKSEDKKKRIHMFQCPSSPPPTDSAADREGEASGIFSRFGEVFFFSRRKDGKSMIAFPVRREMTVAFCPLWGKKGEGSVAENTRSGDKSLDF